MLLIKLNQLQLLHFLKTLLQTNLGLCMHG